MFLKKTTTHKTEQYTAQTPMDTQVVETMMASPGQEGASLQLERTVSWGEQSRQQGRRGPGILRTAGGPLGWSLDARGGRRIPGTS